MTTQSPMRVHRGAVRAAAGPPVYLTSLVGRAGELAELALLLGTGRLVSLVGAGGSGKTRLAAAVAAELGARHREPVWWIDLAALSDAELVTHHVAATLGLREQATRTVIDSLIDHIADAPALLVLDNCEHVLGACAVLADTLLRACPSLRILTTTRQSLGVTGEKAWLVPPLALPAHASAPAAESGAVQLFVERARDALPTFTLTAANVDAVVRICRRLDGLPLAIELAAARVRLLPPEQLATRLDDVFGLLTTRSHVSLPRHRTLRALIDWSYDLLARDERVLFERVAIFAGGFRLESVERVTGWDPIAASDVLDLLASLVDKSLVVMRESNGEARYDMLGTVRHYARARLDGSADGMHTPNDVDTLQRRHALHFLDFAEHAAGALYGARQLEWLERMGEEHDNLRAALAWSIAAADAELALRLCIALRGFWRVRGHVTEGRQWIARALHLPDSPAGLRARTLAAAAMLGRMQGDYACIELLLESEALARGVNDRLALADALTQLGAGLREQQLLRQARARLDEAVALWRALPAGCGLAQALGARASVALAQNDVALARALRVEAVDICRNAGDSEGEALSRIGLGEVARIERDAACARSCNERALALFEQLGDTWHAASVYHNLGWINAESERLDDALHAFNASVALFSLTGNPYGIALCLFGFARLLYERGAAEAAAITLATASSHAARVAKGAAAPADALCCERTRELIESALDAEQLAHAHAAGAGVDIMSAVARAQQRLSELMPARSVANTAVIARDDERAVATREGDALDALDTSSAPQLAVRALGPLEIFVAGQPLAGDAFGSSKPRELLLLLLTHPDGCTREQVGLAFWPESSASQVKNSFHVTLHRLRKALDHPEWIVIAGDRYRLDPALRIQFDASQFETELRAALRDVHGADIADRLAAALVLYQGEFLESEIVGDWHLEIRDRLRQLHTEGLLAYGRLLLEQDRVTDAAAAFRSIRVRDPLHEEACRLLMICYARAGDRVQALRLYESLSALLDAELSVEPDVLTTGLYERLLRAEVV